MIDSRLLIFLKSADKLSFSEAAKELLLTQPAVSFQIKKLEDYFGIPLFYREKNRISLTEAGEILFRQAKKILSCYEEAERAIGQISGIVQGRMMVGASTTMGEYILPKILGDFEGRYPDVKTLLEIGNSDRILNGVLSRYLDVGILAEEVKNRELHQEKIIEDELVLITSSKHPLAGKKKISLQDLEGQRFIAREKGSGTRKEIESHLKKAGIDPQKLRTTMWLGSSEAVKGAVEGGLGISILSRWAIQKEVRLGTLREVPIQGVRMIRDFKLIYYKGKEFSHAMGVFLKFLKEYDWSRLCRK
ncbi:MAG: selenium metabolism-associated LysR family transcriptional regulator [bacterium]